MHKSHLSIISVLGLAFVLAGCGSKGGGELMATVNGETISKDEYISYLERKNQVLVTIQNQGAVQLPVAQPLSFQGLNDLVNQKLLIQMAKEENVLPTEKDVEDEIQLETTRMPTFVPSLTSSGLSLTDIRNELMVSLCRHNLLAKGVKISEAQVDDYIKNNPTVFENPATVDMSWIVLKSKDDEAKVDSDLKAGQVFATVAKQYSTQYSSEIGARYRENRYNGFSPKLKAVVDKLAENSTSPWLPEDKIFIKFHIDKKTPASKMEIKPWMRTLISRQLAEQKGAAAVDLDKRLLAKRKQANIVISKPNLKTKFDELSRTLKEADMKNTSGTAGKASDSSSASNNAPAK